MTCPRCEFVSYAKDKIGNMALYHLKYHHWISTLWWEPLFWMLVVKDFIFWWACRKYEGGYQWRGWKGLKADWELAVTMRKALWGCE